MSYKEEYLNTLKTEIECLLLNVGKVLDRNDYAADIDDFKCIQI